MNSLNRDKEKAFNNPSYDKSLSVRDRLGDFIGKYHVVLNGVVKHDPYVRAEIDGGGMCCQSHKVEILDFVDTLIQEAKDEERKRCLEALPKKEEHNEGYENCEDYPYCYVCHHNKFIDQAISAISNKK